MKNNAHPKMDPNLIAIHEKHEIDHVVARFKKNGHHIIKREIVAAVKKVGHSRKKVYNYLESKIIAEEYNYTAE